MPKVKRVPQRRNGLAGKGKGKSSEAKKEYDRIHSASGPAKRKRADANRKRRAAKKAGKNIKGKDYDHAVKRFVKTSTNRGRKGEGNRVKKS